MLKLKDVVATVARKDVELCIALVKYVIMTEFDKNIAANARTRMESII